MPLLRAIAGAIFGLAAGLLIYGPLSAFAGAIPAVAYCLVYGPWDGVVIVFCAGLAAVFFGLPGVLIAFLLGARAGWKGRPLLPVIRRSWSLYAELVRKMGGHS